MRRGWRLRRRRMFLLDGRQGRAISETIRSGNAINLIPTTVGSSCEIADCAWGGLRYFADRKKSAGIRSHALPVPATEDSDVAGKGYLHFRSGGKCTSTHDNQTSRSTKNLRWQQPTCLIRLYQRIEECDV
jgi:hypothetical protein